MRISDNTKIVLSEDDSSQPKKIRFSEEVEDIDVTNLVDGGGDSKNYPAGTHSVDMSQIAEGRWFFIKADQEITISIDAGPAITLLANKCNRMWMKFISLDFTTTVDTRVTVAVAGE